jgi:hypothetical protein
MRPLHAGSWSGLCVIVVFAVLPAAADSDGVLPAVWKEQHLQLTYLGRTSRYSCDGLRDKVRALLIELGARRDMKIVAAGCAELGEHLHPGRFMPNVHVVFSSPALPDTAKPQHAGDLSAVDARFEAFAITSDAFRNMDIGDCELVEDFARQILPKLAVRDLREDIACVPYEESGSRYLIRGRILRALPRAAQPRAAQPR